MQDYFRFIRQEGKPTEEWEFDASYGTTVVVAGATAPARSADHSAQLARSRSHSSRPSPLP